jgi:hypothetical protein
MKQQGKSPQVVCLEMPHRTPERWSSIELFSVNTLSTRLCSINFCEVYQVTVWELLCYTNVISQRAKYLMRPSLA